MSIDDVLQIHLHDTRIEWDQIPLLSHSSNPNFDQSSRRNWWLDNSSGENLSVKSKNLLLTLSWEIEKILNQKCQRSWWRIIEWKNRMLHREIEHVPMGELSTEWLVTRASLLVRNAQTLSDQYILAFDIFKGVRVVMRHCTRERASEDGMALRDEYFAPSSFYT